MECGVHEKRIGLNYNLESILHGQLVSKKKKEVNFVLRRRKWRTKKDERKKESTEKKGEERVVEVRRHQWECVGVNVEEGGKKEGKGEEGKESSSGDTESRG